MGLLGDLDDNLFKGDLAQLRYELQQQFYDFKDKLDTKIDVFSVYTRNEIDKKLDEIDCSFNTYYTRISNLD